MMRISKFRGALRQTLFVLLVACMFPFLAKAQVGVSPVASTATGQPGNIVSVDLLMYQFTDILSMQFTIDFEESQLSFLNVSDLNLPNLSSSNFGLTNTANGKVSFSWFDSSLLGVSVPDCSAIFRLNFVLLGNTVPQLQITSDPTMIEVVNIDGQPLELEPNLGCSGASQLSGRLFNDANDNCLYQAGEQGMEGWAVKASGNGADWYASSLADGSYSLYLLPGQYQLQAVPPNAGIWAACQPLTNLTVAENDPITLDFPHQALFDCPALEVGIAAPFLRRCFGSDYFVHYCNQGSVTADGAYVEISFDPFLTVNSSSIPWSSVSGNTYTFPLGDLPSGECGDFTVNVGVSCAAVLGQSHCSEAHIFPDAYCGPIDPLWDGADLEVTATCDGDSVRFQVKNIGDDMTEPVDFIVIEDDMIMMTGPAIQLPSLGVFDLAVPASGATWRLELDESPYNPHGTLAMAAVEGCVPGNASFSTGFLNLFPLDDNPVKDIDCQENIGSFDPNDKTGYPNGFCAAHYIESGTVLEYLIRFQNTGTDTAFQVVVVDTLPLGLDPASVLPGAASHPFQFELLGNGVVRFLFDQINLPDSTTNEPASHGFVKFSVAQTPNNPFGTLIHNKADLFFDLNQPVSTNTYAHTVGDGFLSADGNGSNNLSIGGQVLAWYGEPVPDAQVNLLPGCLTATDGLGQFLFTGLDSLSPYSLSAWRENDDPQQGVTVLDLLHLSNSILGITPLGQGAQYLAADLNKSNSITTYDLVIMTKMAKDLPLGMPTPPWEFIDADYSFPASEQYWNAPALLHTDALASNWPDADFTGIKPGNVLTEPMVDSSQLAPEFYLVPGAYNGNRLEVEVRANGFVFVNGFQFGLTWDTTILRLEEVAVEGGPDPYVPLVFEPGYLPVLARFAAPNGVVLPDGSTLFTLVFTAVGPFGSTTTIGLDETRMPHQTVVQGLKLAGGSVQGTEVTLSLPNAAVTVADEGLSLRVLPNPAGQGVPVFCEIAVREAGTALLDLFDQNGTKLQSMVKSLAPGLERVSLAQGLPAGLYVLRACDERGQGRAIKFVVY